jgi:hypothetical protein
MTSVGLDENAFLSPSRYGLRERSAQKETERYRDRDRSEEEEKKRKRELREQREKEKEKQMEREKENKRVAETEGKKMVISISGIGEEDMIGVLFSVLTSVQEKSKVRQSMAETGSRPVTERETEQQLLDNEGQVIETCPDHDPLECNVAILQRQGEEENVEEAFTHLIVPDNYER